MRLDVVHTGIGGVSDSDIEMASSVDGMCVYVYMYVVRMYALCMYVCTYVCMYMFVCVHV